MRWTFLSRRLGRNLEWRRLLALPLRFERGAVCDVGPDGGAPVAQQATVQLRRGGTRGSVVCPRSAALEPQARDRSRPQLMVHLAESA